MTKQNDIRDGIALTLAKLGMDCGCDGCVEDHLPDAEAVMSYLHSRDVVIKVDRGLPERFFIEGYGYLQAHSADALLSKSGYAAVEPLIKGEE